MRSYAPQQHEALVMKMNADLYTSTTDVPTSAAPWIREGTDIYFDEFNHLYHEPRAFAEFLKSTGARLTGVCGDRTLDYVAFKCIHSPLS